MKHALLALAVLLAAAPALAEERPSPSLGGTVLTLLAEEGVSSLLRQGSGGRQSIVARRVRNPGPPIAQGAEGWVYGWTCAPAGCGTEDFFIAWNATIGRLVFMLVDEGRPVFSVPPRAATWPAALEAPVAAFRAALGGR